MACRVQALQHLCTCSLSWFFFFLKRCVFLKYLYRVLAKVSGWGDFNKRVCICVRFQTCLHLLKDLDGMGNLSWPLWSVRGTEYEWQGGWFLFLILQNRIMGSRDASDPVFLWSFTRWLKACPAHRLTRKELILQNRSDRMARRRSTPGRFFPWCIVEERGEGLVFLPVWSRRKTQTQAGRLLICVSDFFFFFLSHLCLRVSIFETGCVCVCLCVRCVSLVMVPQKSTGQFMGFDCRAARHTPFLICLSFQRCTKGLRGFVRRGNENIMLRKDSGGTWLPGLKKKREEKTKTRAHAS